MTVNDQFAFMTLDLDWEPALPFVTGNGPFTQANQQQLIWGFPGVLWAMPQVAMPIWTFHTRRRPFVFPSRTRGPQG